jgi:3',5'-nucleoside bisphosphate phosphatase
MKWFYDLHIHSCLSPCSDEDMTPNNIVNMACLKGLDIIAVSDHNSVDQVQTVMALGQQAGLLVVPAMELCTAEEIHLLCLFPDFAAADRVAGLVFAGMTVPVNRPDIFGHQWILNVEDEPLREETRMLLAASGMDVDTALRAVDEVGGVVVPAHVDRDAYSMVATLGLIPPEYGLRVVEVTAACPPCDEAERAGVVSAERPACLRNSDAHHLWAISEPEHAVELSERTIAALLEALREGSGLAGRYPG